MPITIPTVFVLGAGASVHAGYPVGSELKRAVLKSAFEPTDSFLQKGLPNGWTLEEVRAFAQEMAHAQDPSVDAFLERVEPVPLVIGKYLIGAHLKTLERAERLFPPYEDWYGLLFKQLVDTQSSDPLAGNNVSFVTFNYDRTLEAFLHRALRARLRSTDEVAIALLQRLPIVHVYGQLGAYPAVPYQTSESIDEVLSLSREIRVMHEGGVAASFARAKQMIETAERVIFLGFGFHYANVERLGILWGARSRTLISTSIVQTRAEHERVFNPLARLGLRDTLFAEQSFNFQCYDLFRHGLV